MVNKYLLTIFGLGYGRQVVPSQYVISTQSELHLKDKSLFPGIVWRSAAGLSPLAASSSVLLQVHRWRLLVLVSLSQDGGKHQVE